MSRGDHIPKPPATLNASPVIQLASSEARNATAAATASGVPIRPRGAIAVPPASNSPPTTPADRVPSVPTRPGLAALTRTCLAAASRRSVSMQCGSTPGSGQDALRTR